MAKWAKMVKVADGWSRLGTLVCVGGNAAGICFIEIFYMRMCVLLPR